MSVKEKKSYFYLFINVLKKKCTSKLCKQDFKLCCNCNRDYIEMFDIT